MIRVKAAVKDDARARPEMPERPSPLTMQAADRMSLPFFARVHAGARPAPV